MAFLWQAGGPLAFWYAYFFNPEEPNPVASREEPHPGMSREDQPRVQDRDSAGADTFRMDLPRPGAAIATKAHVKEWVADGRKGRGSGKSEPPFAILTIPETVEKGASEADTASGLSLTVGPVSSLGAGQSGRSDTHASECSSLAPYWMPDEIRHYFRHRHWEEDSSGKTDVALREIGRERELPAIDDSDWSGWRAKWCHNPRPALVAVVAVMTGALLAMLLSAVVDEFHVALPGSRARGADAAAPGDDSAAAPGEGTNVSHGDFPMPIPKRESKRDKEATTPEDVNTTRPHEVEEVTASGVEEPMPNGDAEQMHSAAGEAYKRNGFAGSNTSVHETCGRPAFRFCSGGQAEFYYNGTRQACMMLTPDGPGLCNRGRNRFTSMESCRQQCVDGDTLAHECYHKAVLAQCEARDVVDTWWWYLEGKGCRHWRFPRGRCPSTEGNVFPTSLECVRRCVDAKGSQPPCIAPMGVACNITQLRFGYVAEASPRGSGARRCRQLPSAGGESKLHRCLAGANKFPTLEACQRRCVRASS
ncbi:uncharacterized protein [Dermacentor albipictus]|uniref:uncharacterized protein n=1 Tax=Dermacentor albipictus TaxID=60249 RepID=UPI0031FDB7C7